VSNDNGLTWTKAPQQGSLDAPGEQIMKAVVTTSDGERLIAVGTDSRDESAAVWSSTDGRSWTRVHSRALRGPGVADIAGVISYGEGLIMVGTWGPPGDRDATAWLSPDGRRWERTSPPGLGGPGNQVIKAVVLLDGRLVAVGNDTGVGDGDPAVWIGTPVMGPAPAPTSPTPSGTRAAAGGTPST
jgi:hypothetical protein